MLLRLLPVMLTVWFATAPSWVMNVSLALAVSGWGFWSTTQVSKPGVVLPSAKYQDIGSLGSGPGCGSSRIEGSTMRGDCGITGVPGPRSGVAVGRMAGRVGTGIGRSKLTALVALMR